MNYPSIRLEGAILSGETIDRLVDLPGQKPSDFGLDAGTNVKDEIVRAWADAQDYWRIFQRKLETVRSESSATTETRNLWIVPLLGLLRYDLEYQKVGAELNGKVYAISHRGINRGNLPVHIVGYRDPAGLDRKPTNATLRMSAHAMLQEYLNLNEELYGIVTNGRVLRLLRDSSRLINLSYVEFDLDRIFTDGLFADFAVLYRLIHASRLPSDSHSQSESIIERLHQDSLDAGARIREGLSKAVEQAILDFANGFLAHPENQGLRDQIASNQVSADKFYECLLHLIYRLLFLMVIEERRLIFPDTATSQQRNIYQQCYSVHRLRFLSEKRFLAERRQSDLWLSLLSTFRLFESHSPGVKLGIQPLAGDLFEPAAIGPLADAQLSNEALLSCLRSLSLYQSPNKKQIIRVNYGALNVEEFGSVYEGLLEYEATIDLSRRVPVFGFKQGEERSATGSHYTPDELVQPLIKHSLDHLIERCLRLDSGERGKTPAQIADTRAMIETALLNLRVIDISCGSGHILLAAARRIATELAIVRTGEEQPSPIAFRQALRDVIRSCIYGVDLNPLAVELCKVALWLEAHVPGEPLNFLDNHIKCGNSIVGFVRKEEVDAGIPDEAFVKLPGDDPEIGRLVRARNKRERKERKAGVRKLQFTETRENQFDAILNQAQIIARMPERTPDEIEDKKQAHEKLSLTGPIHDLRQLASLPIAQFYLPRTEDNESLLITDEEFHKYWSGNQFPQGPAIAKASAIAFRKKFFHWFIEFPEIIARGGFDCVLGNPPYLGGQALSGTYGHEFCAYVKHAYAPTGLSDLVIFFVRRIYQLLGKRGFAALNTTNSITDGDNRRDGLEQILAAGAQINMAIRSVKWPGRANVAVSLFAINKEASVDLCVLDGKQVECINAFFEDGTTETGPTKILESKDRIYQGVIFLGDGFLIEHDEATILLAKNSKYREVVLPVINGKEANSDPKQQPGRHIINFKDWDEDKAREFTSVFEIIETRVRPDRERQRDINAKKYWWRFLRPRLEMTEAINRLRFCFATARVTKHFCVAAFPTEYVFLNNLYVLTTDRWDVYASMQSTIHEIWTRKYSMRLEDRLQYSPTDCFETFAFPVGLWDTANPLLAEIGERYHEHRRQLMLHLWLGLTDVYNLFHSRELEADLTKHIATRTRKDPQGQNIPAEHRDIALSFTFDQALADLLELRRLHAELDQTVLAAYGWHISSTDNPAIDLAHDFYDIETLPENDRTRYTISPTARRELLTRLLAENHRRAAEEATSVAIKAKPKKKAKTSRSGLLPMFDAVDRPDSREFSSDEKTILTIVASFPRINFEGVEELAGIFTNARLRKSILNGTSLPKRRAKIPTGIDAVYGRLIRENLLEQLPGDVPRLKLGSALENDFSVDSKSKKAIEEIKIIIAARIAHEATIPELERSVRQFDGGGVDIVEGAFSAGAT